MFSDILGQGIFYEIYKHQISNIKICKHQVENVSVDLISSPSFIKVVIKTADSLYILGIHENTNYTFFLGNLFKQIRNSF